MQNEILCEQDEQFVLLYLKSRNIEHANEIAGVFEETLFFQNAKIAQENELFVFQADGYFNATNEILDFFQKNKQHLYSASFVRVNNQTFFP